MPEQLDRGGPVGDLQLVHDRGDVHPHRAGRKYQLFGDLGGRQPLGEQLKYLPFAARESPSCGFAANNLPPSRLPPVEAVEYACDQRSLDGRLTGADADERSWQPAQVHGFQQVPVRTGSQRGEKVGVVVGNGKHHDLGVRQPGGNLPRRGDPAARHPDVENADIRPLANGSLHGLGGISHHRADFERLVAFERPAHVFAGRLVVVSDQHPQWPRAGIHRAASTSLPPPGAEEMRSSPPTERARCRMEISPKPPLVTLGSNPRPWSLTRSRSREPLRSSWRLTWLAPL